MITRFIGLQAAAASVGRVTVSGLLTVGSALILGIVNARVLGPDGLGSLTLIVTISAIAILVLTLGTGASLRVRAHPIPSPQDVRAYLGFTLLLAPTTGALIAVAAALVSDRQITGTSLLLTAAYGTAAFGARQFGDLVQAFGRTNSSIVSLAFGSLLGAAFVAGFAVYGIRSLPLAILGATFGATAQILFCVAVLWPRCPHRRPAFAPAAWFELVAHGYPTIGYSVGLVFLQRLDRLLLVPLAGAGVAGVYALAATVAEASRILPSAVGQLLFVRTAESRGLDSTTRAIFSLAVISQVLISASLALLAPSIVPFLFGPEFQDSIALARGLLVAEFFLGMALMSSRIVMGLGRLGDVGVLTIAIALASVPTYWLLISTKGASGAVMASIGCYTLYSAMLLIHQVRAPEGRRPVDELDSHSGRDRL